MATKHRHELSTGWKWLLADSNGVPQAENHPALKDWTSVTAFPSVIQMELLEHGIIANPDIGENERLIQWVGHADWAYMTSFPSPSGLGSSVDLVFDGLDTFATVILNGKEILKSDNMFIPYRVDVKDDLKPEGEANELSIIFESVYKKGTELEAKYGERKSLLRDRRRNYVRKAQVCNMYSLP